MNSKLGNCTWICGAIFTFKAAVKVATSALSGLTSGDDWRSRRRARNNAGGDHHRCDGGSSAASAEMPPPPSVEPFISMSPLLSSVLLNVSACLRWPLRSATYRCQWGPSGGKEKKGEGQPTWQLRNESLERRPVMKRFVCPHVGLAGRASPSSAGILQIPASLPLFVL